MTLPKTVLNSLKLDTGTNQDRKINETDVYLLKNSYHYNDNIGRCNLFYKNT